ncbi:hypothetical protein AB0939_07285 [Streptomyces sp. NPDC006990]|uniref:hypothetical protein n=1 Tax=Streptomyces sp. NPDC006990 TaxID=3154481 RepID=UPI0034516D3F
MLLPAACDEFVPGLVHRLADGRGAGKRGAEEGDAVVLDIDHHLGAPGSRPSSAVTASAQWPQAVPSTV